MVSFAIPFVGTGNAWKETGLGQAPDISLCILGNFRNDVLVTGPKPIVLIPRPKLFG